MIKFETWDVQGFDAALWGMRNPMKSYNKCDSAWIYDPCERFIIGKKDYQLAKSLWKAGTEHRKWLRMVIVWVDIWAPRYWWTEWDTYKIGTVANSESTMHKLKDEEFSDSDFDYPWGIDQDCDAVFHDYIDALKNLVQYRMNQENKEYKEQYHRMLKAMLPEGFIQKRTVCLNYEVLANMYQQRKNHALPQWNTDFTEWIKTLPYHEFITGDFNDKK